MLIELSGVMGRSLSIVGFCLLAGCAAPAVISDINDSAVKVQGNAYTPFEEITAEANQGCGHYNKSAVPISRACADYYCSRTEYLFACK